MKQLLDNPKEYDGKTVRLIGYVYLEFEGDVITKGPDKKYRRPIRNIWLDVDAAIRKDHAKYHQQYVLVEGTLNAGKHGHMDLSIATIENIKRFDVVDVRINFPLASVRECFNEASVVVRMNIKNTKPTGTEDGTHYGFIASGRVLQSFKGKFKRGQLLEFYSRVEYGYDHAQMRGDQIAFLTSFVDRRNGPFQELPDGNSVDPYSRGLAAKVRTVALTSQRKRNNR